MKKLNFTCFVHISCLVLVFTVAGSGAKECGDAKCKAPIAKGYATLSYMGGGGQKVNMKKGEKLLILGRDFGKDKDFLVQTVNGITGLASTKFVRETEILISRKNRILIPEEESQEEINPSATTEPSVVDGTTISSVPLTNPSVAPQEPAPVEEKTPDLEVVPSNQDSTTLPMENKESSETKTAEVIEAKVNKNEVVEEDEDEESEENDGEEDDGEEEQEENEDEEDVESVSADHDTFKLNNISIEQSSTGELSESEKVSQEVMIKEKEISDKQELPASEHTTSSMENSTADAEFASSKENSAAFVEAVASKENLAHDSNEPVTVTEVPLVNEHEVHPPTEPVETTTANSVEELSSETTASSTTFQDVVEQTTIPSNLPYDTPRLEIPVTEQPEEIPESVTFNPNTVDIEAPTSTESALPQAPSGLLKGGLGSLLSHSHHHHHHHGHDHGHDHHGHEHHLHVHHEDGHHHEQQQTKEIVQQPAEVEGQKQATSEDHQRDVPLLEEVGKQPLDEISTQTQPLEERTLDFSFHEEAVDHKIQSVQQEDVPEDGYCDQQSCPQPNPSQLPSHHQHANGFHHPMVKGGPNNLEILENDHYTTETPEAEVKNEEEELDYAKMFVLELFKLSDLILLLAVTSFTLIVFSLGHYLINKNRKEKPLIYKLNMVERDLMASHKENAMLKSDLAETKHKLTSIENNSFGSNDMVIALRQELEDSEQTKLEMQEQITSLEKELENAAEAGLELNKMVAELLNQSGSDSIALTVDELQKQLNEQQQTILSMNTTLADKSRENSELQITLANQTTRFQQDIEELQQSLNDVRLEKNNLEIELNNIRSGQGSQLDILRKETGTEIAKLNKEVKSYQSKWEEAKKGLSTAEAKVEALEDCIKDIKKGKAGGTVDGLIDSAELKAQLTVLNKEKANLQDRLQGEIVARQLLEDHVKIINEDISSLKKEFGQAEKDKLEAETRLEVLSSYFKDKETQLQKELSIKEAMWMQQQGETTSTVERIRLMQDETQQLKSQNDKLRAEIEAQATAHKAQYTALETRSHDAWLAARQAERRLEESRNESSALRRKLTALGDVSVNNVTTDGLIPNTITPADMNLTAPSPIRVESPNAPPMMALPPPPFMPPPFVSPFMPPFMPPPGPGEMRPAPLGRLMSPPPPNRYSPSLIDSRDRYTPERGRYSPDSRYQYSVMSNYETETDFSPPPSPPPHSRRSNYDRERDHRSDRDRDRDHDLRDRDRDVRERDGRTSGNAGGVDRGSGAGGYPKAFSPPSMRTTSPPIQDPRNKKYQGGGFSSGSQDSMSTRKSGKQYKNSKPTA
ncbi:transport and Golgi organization protein 1-like [Armigeres subalbatus]|uniref:transport and Golgi organization protein 1-like n=1 Tax=Armigeres subalbatus TaxID=124917 RepID=UPI002ED23307